MDSQITIRDFFPGGYGIWPRAIARTKKLSFEEKGLLSYFISFTGGGNSCFPSIKTMSEENGKTPKTIIKIIKSLKQKNIIETERLYPDDPFKKNNLYIINFSVLKSLCENENSTDTSAKNHNHVDDDIQPRSEKNTITNNRKYNHINNGINSNSINNNNISNNRINKKSAHEKNRALDDTENTEIAEKLDEKQELRKLLHGWFRANNPYYHAEGKEAGAINNIIKRLKNKNEILILLEKFKWIISHSPEPYWRNKPIVPSQFLTNIDNVVAFKTTRKKTNVPQTEEEIRELYQKNCELMQDMEDIFR